MNNAISWRLLAVIAMTIALTATHANADPSYVRDAEIGCNTPKSVDIYDVTPKVAFNYFGRVSQQIGAITGVYSTCDPNRNARWEFEGTIASIDQPGGTSYSAQFGIGYEFRLFDNVVAVPAIRLGMDAFPHGDSEFVESGEVAIEANYLLDDAAHNTRLILDETPYYTSRQTATTSLPGPGRINATFSNLVVAGIDFRAWAGWRMKTSLAYNYIAHNSTVTSIGSIIVSARDEGPNGIFTRSYELEYSHGNGRFDGVLFSVDFHWL